MANTLAEQPRVVRVAQQAPALAAMVIAAIIGIGISLYLTAVHNQAVPLVCSTTGLVDCASVLKSPYAVVPGTQIPITFPGLIWFVVSGGIALASLSYLWRGLREPHALRQAAVAWGGLGILTVLYLVYVEIVKLHHLCAWCTGVHVLVLATVLLALQRLSEPVITAPLRPSKATNSVKSSAKTSSTPVVAPVRPTGKPMNGATQRSPAPAAARRKKAKR